MDLILIVRDALASALVGTLLVARDAHASGKRVAVLVTGEALAAVAGGSFAWPRELAGQAMRLGLADRGGKALGLPLTAKGEARQLDAKALLAATVADGVAVFACPLWSALLGLDAPPAGLATLDRPGLTRLLAEAGRVVGSL
jgi:peroxiredoxin family protein